jgi:hypothetical protein
VNIWNSTTEMIVTIAMGIIAVAVFAVLVSKKSNTAAVIQAGASGFSNALAVAIAPVTGAKVDPVLAYPGQGLGGAGMGYAGI